MQKYVVWILLGLIIIYRYFSSLPEYNDGDRIRITSRVDSEPIVYDTSQYLRLAGLKIYLPLFPRISYGDKIVVEGVVDKDKLKNPQLLEVKENKNTLYKFRNKIIDFYRSALPEPHSSLIAGVTLGSKSSIPKSFWENLKHTGTAHVVVASGMNVTLVAGFLVNTLIVFVKRQKAVWISIVGVWIYAVVSGFDPPIVRAAIMGSISFSAVGLGKINTAWRALFLSALAMLIVKPIWLVDLGFILSFLATASLMLFQKRVDKLIKFVPTVLREGLSTSFAAQVFVAPVIYATFGQFNPLSPIINGLVLWVIAPITIIGMLAGVVGIYWFNLGRFIVLLTYPLTSWFIGIVNLFS